MKKNITNIILVMILCITMSFNSYASETKVSSLEQMDMTECNNFVMQLVLDILNNKTDFIENNTAYFTENEYNEFKSYANSNKIMGDKIGQLVIDTTYPNNSSTADTVIMANIKVLSDDQACNMIYLLELHINRDGKIYGHNIWVY